MYNPDSEIMAGSDESALFPSFARVKDNPTLSVFQRKSLDTKTCLELLLIDKVVCVKKDSRLMDIKEAQRAFRYLEFNGQEMRESACTKCYAHGACKGGSGLKVVKDYFQKLEPKLEGW